MSYNNGSAGVLTNCANDEKQQMQYLNDKLAKYIQGVRNLRGEGQVDPAKYHAMLQGLEDELKKLKDAYNHEINKLRRALQDANQQKTALQAEVERQQELTDDLRKKVNEETDRNRRLQDQNNKLQYALAEKDKQIADLIAKLKEQAAELDRMGPDYGRLNRENEALKKALDQERKDRKLAQDKCKQLDDKNRFDNQRHDQENKDLSDRLKQANDIIRDLEEKLKNAGADLPRLMKKLRDGMEDDLRRAQKQTEDALKNDLAQLKDAMEQAKKDKDAQDRLLKQMNDDMDRLKRRNGELEGQNKGLRQQNKDLLDELQNERNKAGDRVRMLEDKLREMQDHLMNKLKDFNVARDAQASLQAEIDTYRRLLNAEEQRLGVKPESRAGSRNMGGSAPQMGSRGGSRVGSRAGSTLPAINGSGKGRGRGHSHGPFCTTYQDAFAHKRS